MLFLATILLLALTGRVEAYVEAPANVVVLYLTVSDCDTGETLYSKREEMPEFGNAIEFCRANAVIRALELTAAWRLAGHPNASTNVNCTWEQGTPLAPA